MARILIVEDDPVVAGVYGTKYARAGFETRTAEDGEVALQILKTFTPDLVHLDLQIPKVNGVEIIKHLRGQEATRTLPIVVLSNTYQNHLVKSAMAAGATQCISKAVCTPKAMLETVMKLLPSPAAAVPEAPKPPTAPRAPGLFGTDVDVTFQAEIRRGFTERAPAMLSALGEKVRALMAKESDADRANELSDLWRTTHAFAGNAGVAGFKDLAQMASALDALINELIEKPRHVTPSSLRTIEDARDFLTVLLERGTESETDTLRSPVVLVVDDEVISRKAVCLAVARLNIPALSVEDPQVALRLLPENRFALVFLDVEMPGINGYEVCAALRQSPAHKETPVVFVTSLTGFENRERTISSGGNDVIAKPFLGMELAVKALRHILRGP